MLMLIFYDFDFFTGLFRKLIVSASTIQHVIRIDTCCYTQGRIWLAQPTSVSSCANAMQCIFASSYKVLRFSIQHTQFASSLQTKCYQITMRIVSKTILTRRGFLLLHFAIYIHIYVEKENTFVLSFYADLFPRNCIIQNREFLDKLLFDIERICHTEKYCCTALPTDFRCLFLPYKVLWIPII